MYSTCTVQKTGNVTAATVSLKHLDLEGEGTDSVSTGMFSSPTTGTGDFAERLSWHWENHPAAKLVRDFHWSSRPIMTRKTPFSLSISLFFLSFLFVSFLFLSGCLLACLFVCLFDCVSVSVCFFTMPTSVSESFRINYAIFIYIFMVLLQSTWVALPTWTDLSCRRGGEWCSCRQHRFQAGSLPAILWWMVSKLGSLSKRPLRDASYLYATDATAACRSLHAFAFGAGVHLQYLQLAHSCKWSIINSFV